VGGFQSRKEVNQTASPKQCKLQSTATTTIIALIEKQCPLQRLFKDFKIYFRRTLFVGKI
jgi:hypothetical protein